MHLMSHSIRIMLLGTASLVLGLTNAAMATPPSVPPVTFASLAGPPVLPASGLIHISDYSLSEIRGGFSLPNNAAISIDFGFSIRTVVNGSLVQNLTGDIQHITQQITPAFYGSTSGAMKHSTVSFSNITNTATPTAGVNTEKTATSSSSTFTTTLSASQPGSQLATTIANTLGSSGVTSLVKNQANNQVIQETRSLNISITGMQTQLRNSAQSSQLIQALAPK